MDWLFHVSASAGVCRFEPRPPPAGSAGVDRPCVWAIDAVHLCNYWLPRVCPRICFRSNELTSEADRERLGGPWGHDAPVIVIEQAWIPRILASELWEYRFDPAPFSSVDPIAGYHVAYQSVIPESSRRLGNPLECLIGAGVELRILPRLWATRDRVLQSQVDYSLIRMRNALAPV